MYFLKFNLFIWAYFLLNLNNFMRLYFYHQFFLHLNYLICFLKKSEIFNHLMIIFITVRFNSLTIFYFFLSLFFYLSYFRYYWLKPVSLPRFLYLMYFKSKLTSFNWDREIPLHYFYLNQFLQISIFIMTSYCLILLNHFLGFYVNNFLWNQESALNCLY